MRRSWLAMRRATEMTSPKTSSATLLAFASATLQIATPFSAAEATSILSYPTLVVWMSLSFFAASITVAVIGAPVMITSTSWAFSARTA